jgi:hypothetical protein
MKSVLTLLLTVLSITCIANEFVNTNTEKVVNSFVGIKLGDSEDDIQHPKYRDVTNGQRIHFKREFKYSEGKCSFKLKSPFRFFETVEVETTPRTRKVCRITLPYEGYIPVLPCLSHVASQQEITETVQREIQRLELAIASSTVNTNINDISNWEIASFLKKSDWRFSQDLFKYLELMKKDILTVPDALIKKYCDEKFPKDNIYRWPKPYICVSDYMPCNKWPIDKRNFSVSEAFRIEFKTSTLFYTYAINEGFTDYNRGHIYIEARLSLEDRYLTSLAAEESLAIMQGIDEEAKEKARKRQDGDIL